MSQTSISSQTRHILNKHDLFLKKSLGQNFLTNSLILDQIVNAANLSTHAGVIEIGPGIGALTEKLANQAHRVVAIELDQRLIPILGDLFASKPHVHFVHGDALKLDLNELIREYFTDGEELYVVANLPYYVTSPIITRMLESRLPFKRMVMMVQREVADRFTASPGQKAYGSLSVLVQYFTQAQQVASVPRQFFFPQPNVDSAVVRFDFRSRPAVQVVNESLYFQVVRGAFAKRRKTLPNSLYGSFSSFLSKEEIQTLLAEAQVDPMRRGETLTLAEFASITERFYQRIPNEFISGG